MRQGSTRTPRALPPPPRRGFTLTYPDRRRHGLLVSLFPRNYWRFLLIGLVGKAVILLALAGCFVIAAAFAAGLLDEGFQYAAPLAGIGLAIYQLLAERRVRVHNLTFRPIRPTGVALAILALSCVWIVQVVIPSDTTLLP